MTNKESGVANKLTEWASMIKFEVFNLRGKYDSGNPLTWSISPKSRAMDLSTFPISDAIKEIFEDKSVDSLFFTSYLEHVRGASIALIISIRSGDDVSSLNLEKDKVMGYGARELCYMDNIALIKSADGPMWIARDGEKYDFHIAEAGKKARANAVAETVLKALARPGVNQGLEDVANKLKGKAGTAFENPIGAPDSEPRKPK